MSWMWWPSFKTVCSRSMYLMSVAGGSMSLYLGFVDLVGLEVRQVSGRSMQPAINPDCYRPVGSKASLPWLDWVLVRSCDGDDVKPGDIITLDNPKMTDGKDIKRVIAVENEQVLTRSYKNRVVVVPKGYLWVEGDNHGVSKDSNQYGPVPKSLVFGKAIAVLFPPSRVHLLTSERPPQNSVKIMKALNAAESQGTQDYHVDEDDDDDMYG